MKTTVALAALVLLIDTGLAEAKMLGRAGAFSPTVYRSGAFWRALLLTKPPPYWMGGTVFVPLAPFVRPEPVVHSLEPPPPLRPIWKRIPDVYIAAAYARPPAGPLWVKTRHGFRLEGTR